MCPNKFYVINSLKWIDRYRITFWFVCYTKSVYVWSFRIWWHTKAHYIHVTYSEIYCTRSLQKRVRGESLKIDLINKQKKKKVFLIFENNIKLLWEMVLPSNGFDIRKDCNLVSLAAFSLWLPDFLRRYIIHLLNISWLFKYYINICTGFHFIFFFYIKR